MMVRYKVLLLFISLLAVFELPAQEARKNFRRGQRAYKQEQFTQAEEAYRESLSKDSTSIHTRYALANTLYQQNKFAEAMESFLVLGDKLAQLPPEKQADIWHNLGNSLMKQQKYAQAAESYKQALIHNPAEDSRYNYVLAKKLQEKQDQQQQNQSQDDKNQSQDDKQQEQNPQPQDADQKPNEKTPQQQQAIDKKTAEQILNSYQQDDDKTRQKYDLIERRREEDKDNTNKKRW